MAFARSAMPSRLAKWTTNDNGMTENGDTNTDHSDKPIEHSLTPPSAEKTLQWITVLSAAGLDYRLSHTAGRWHLHLPAAQAPQAIAEIQAFEADERRPVRSHPSLSPPLAEATIHTAHWTAFWAAYTLVILHLLLGPFDGANPLHVAAAMSRSELLQGEWWRSITALTLHSGLPHLMANAFFLFFVGQAVVRELGRGLGLAAIVLGGIAGNYAAALTAAPYQRSVGASTACFAALGILCAVQAGYLYRRFHTWMPVWRKTWIPIAAGIALLGLTGTSEGSDIAAHFFGFICGIGIALPIAYYPKIVTNTSATMQWGLLTITAILLPLAWFFAYLQQVVAG